MGWLAEKSAFLFSQGRGRNPYESIKNAGTRAHTRRDVGSEDWSVSDMDADYMGTRIRDLTRNAALPAWVVRRHVDYLTNFDFKSVVKDQDELNNDIEQWMDEWSSRFNCDANRKHSLPTLIRLIEQSRVTDGDVFTLKIGGDGPLRGSLQLIEGQRVRDPVSSDKQRQFSKQNWVRGIRLTANGIASQYAIHRRNGHTFELERIAPATSIVQTGYYQRVDMIRGVSPLHAAANTFKDLHETQVYATAGVKAAQLVGLVIKQNYQGNNLGGEYVDPVNSRRQNITWGPRPEVLNLNAGEEADFIDSRKPSIETVAYLEALQFVAMKALDIPRTAWDESIANYSSMRAARTEYETAQRHKIRELRETLNEITRWRLGMAFADGELTFPAGVTWDDIAWKWQHLKQPFIDPEKEAKAIQMQQQMGLTNPYDSAAQIGQDYEENIMKTNRAQEFAQEQGGFIPYYGQEQGASNESP